MQSVTVAVVEIDQDYHVPVEELLRQSGAQVELLTDTLSENAHAGERRELGRDGIASVDNAVARIKRLNPRILLINANKSMAEYCDLLLALQQQCPDTQAILIINESIEEDYLLKTLACGARGFITNDLDLLNFSKIVGAIHRGEAWLSRKMIAKMMRQIVSEARYNSLEVEVNFDSLG